MLKIKELNLTCMINDSERITEKLGHCVTLKNVSTKKRTIPQETHERIKSMSRTYKINESFE